MGLKIKPKFGKYKPWGRFFYINIYYASDPNYCRRISCYILYVKGVSIFCISEANES